MNISAREVNIAKLPKEAQNWENRHLRYTHGYGAVITPAAQDADAPLTWYLRDLNIHSDVNLTVEHPDIYYGQEQYDYAIVPNELNVVGIAGTEPHEEKAYHGEGGIPFTSIFKKALFAFKLADEKLFFQLIFLKIVSSKFTVTLPIVFINLRHFYIWTKTLIW